MARTDNQGRRDMRSYQFDKYGEPLRAVEAETPAPSGTEVLVRVEACGVCHSDIHLWDGYFDLGDDRKADLSRSHSLPLTLGHEIVGVVEAMGDQASGANVGDKAVVYPWIGCGDCPACNSDSDHLCPRPRALGVNADGGYADHVMVPNARFLYAYGDVETPLACTYACSGITAYGALKKVQSRTEGRSLLIIGAGGVGLAGLMIAQAMMDTTIIVADIDDAKLETAKAAGADHVINPTADGARKELIGLTGGGANGAVDFVGSDKSAGFGMQALANGGMLIVVGLFGGSMKLSVPLLPLKNIMLGGSYVGSPEEMRELMDLVVAGKVKPLPVATRPLAEADQTLRDLRDGKIVGRMVLTP